MKITNIGIWIGMVGLILFSCKRDEPTRWNVDLKAPIAYGRLSVGNLVPDANISSDSDGIVHFVIEESLTDFDLDSLLNIPDTNFYDFLKNEFFPLQISPGGIVIPPEEADAEMNIPNVQLREIISKSGSLEYTLKNFVDGNLLATYGLPKATINGESIYIEETLPPGTFENPSITTGFYDLSGYHFDLTGVNGDSYNQMYNSASLNAAADNTQNVNIPVQDSVISTNIFFIEPEVSYARGYFGQHSFEIDDQVDLDQLDAIISGNLDIGEVDLDLIIANYSGIDVQIELENLIGYNSLNETSVALENTDLQSTINLARAVDFNGDVSPNIHEINLDETNSNLDEWIENLPNQLQTLTQIEVNPLGDISGGNDFIYVDQALDAKIILDLPLCVGIDNLRFNQIVDIDFSEEAEIDGELIIMTENSFPLGGSLTLSIIDEEEELVYNLLEGALLETGSYSIETFDVSTQSNEIRIPINSEVLKHLRENDQILIDITLNSFNSEQVKFTSSNYIDVSIYLDAELEISFE